MTGDKFTGVYSKYNEDDIPGTRVEPYDEKYVKRLQSENEKLKKTCEEYALWLGEKQTGIEHWQQVADVLEKEKEALKTRIKEADKRAKPYGMDEWKGGEAARASYIERITALEKENVMLIENNNEATAVNEAQKEALVEIELIAAGQDRIIREQELRHRAELEKLRKALGMFLFHPTAFNESVENARRVLAVKEVTNDHEEKDR